MIIKNYVKVSNRGFNYLASPENEKEKAEFIKVCQNANLKTRIFNNEPLNTQHLQVSHIPKLMLTGEFRKYYGLTLTEILFLMFITDNKNAENLDNINKNEWVYYYKQFNYITSNSTTQKNTIDSLRKKGFIYTKYNTDKTGFYICYTPTIIKYNELFDNIINNKLLCKKQLTTTEKMLAEKKLYIYNVKKFFPIRYNAYKTIQSTEYNCINGLQDIVSVCDIQKTFAFIPMFLKTQYPEIANKLDNLRKSPMLYFIRYFKEYEHSYFEFLQSDVFKNNELEEIDIGKEKAPEEEEKELEKQREIDRLLAMI